VVVANGGCADSDAACVVLVLVLDSTFEVCVFGCKGCNG
jgi:hypothetical protein